MSDLIITAKLNINVYEHAESDSTPEMGYHDTNLSSNVNIDRVVFENNPFKRSLDSIKIDTILECLKYKFKGTIDQKIKEIKSAREYIGFRRYIDQFCGEILRYIDDKKPDELKMEDFITRSEYVKYL